MKKLNKQVMMVNFKYTPIELGKELLEKLYNKIDSKWKWELSIERKIRETTLVHTMLDLGKNHMSIALRYFTKKCISKMRAYKILRNIIKKVVQERKLVWKKEFELILTPIEEEEKEKEDDRVELDNTKDLYNDAKQLVEAVEKMAQKCIPFNYQGAPKKS